MADANATLAPLTQTPPPDVSLFGSVLTMAAALCLILGLLFLGFHLLRRFGGPGLSRVRGAAAPVLVGRLFLGNRQSVAVVRVLNKTLVLGVTDQNVSLLTEAENTDAPRAESGAGFAQVLESQDDPASSSGDPA